MTPIPLAAVVVNLDGGAMLDACLDALAAEAPSATVVVDNGSTPAELARLEARGGVAVVRLPENRGLAAPANAGLSAALGVELAPADEGVGVVGAAPQEMRKLGKALPEDVAGQHGPAILLAGSDGIKASYG